MTIAKRVGFGCTIGWDVAGGSSYQTIASVVDGDKTEAKWNVANTSLLSDKAQTFAKTSYDAGELKLKLNYDPEDSEYVALKASFVAVNVIAPTWLLTLPDVGNGSGSATESFSALIVGLSREVMKDNYMECELTLKLTGAI